MIMVPEDVREEAEKLKKELRHHSYLYYVLDKPEISDYEFDHMYRKLVLRILRHRESGERQRMISRR